ncbi:hypothetical protein M0Q97_08795 [Candidatus Dojkabacteria bacterium]|jgi:hypothetical protein|nr:hypothetical protein [Candidatus Dojkabacteria bacterium]
MKHIKIFEEFNKYRTLKIIDIEYDADDEDISELPTELDIKIPINIKGDEIDEYISDEISNITGFCHNGYNTIPELNLFKASDKYNI